MFKQLFLIITIFTLTSQITLASEDSQIIDTSDDKVEYWILTSADL